MAASTSTQAKIDEARTKRDNSLAKVEPRLEGIPVNLPLNVLHLPESILTPRELEITGSYPVTKLLQLLRNRELSVEEVTRAFLRRAAVAHAATNCLTELLWDEALARARYLDALPKPQGALFGLPISIKEHLGMVGSNITTNAGMVAWIGKEHSSTLIVETLWNEGCVFHARTTLPQAAMSLETDNNIYGRTVNPHNRHLTVGGSSSGEAALIAMRGSLLGIGTDIGGSIRVPAAHNGLYGFKPTAKRISAKGIRHYEHGEICVFGSPGPMTTDRECLEMLMKVAIGAEPWTQDETITEMTWREYVFVKPLKVAVMWWDGIVRPQPPMRRALTEVANACRRAGMRVVDWDCTHLDHAKGWEILSALYWVDGGEGLRELLAEGGEDMLPLTRYILEEQRHVKALTPEEVAQKKCERDEYREMYAKAWDDTAQEDGQEVDVILCPAFYGAAPEHDQSRYWDYSSMWNLLDYPAATFPVTSVDAKTDQWTTTSKPGSEEDRLVHEQYDNARVLQDGAPVGLQVVGRRHCDEKVLAALAEIERAMGRP